MIKQKDIDNIHDAIEYRVRKQTLKEVDKWVEEEFRLKIGYVSLIKFRKKFGLEAKK